MVIRSSKIAPKKRKTHPDEAAVETTPPVSAATEAAAPTEAPEPEPVKAVVDFGRGIGDILGQSEAHAKPQASEPPELPTDNNNERIAIDQILSRARNSDDTDVAAPPRVSGPSFSKVPSGPRLMLAGLFALVLIFSAAAIAGILMFYRKNGAPDLAALWSRMSLFTKQAPPVQQAPPEQQPPEPARNLSVNATVAISTQKGADISLPLILTRSVETDVTEKMSFPATGSVPAKVAKAKGTATIVNTLARPFTFVATTRLLSKDGVLFRMVKTTPIPASGQVDVAVVADKAGPEGDVGPTTFTIPGLPPAYQDKVTAMSSSEMSGGSGTIAAVTADDIAKAKAALQDKIKPEALADLAAAAHAGEKVLPELVVGSEAAFKAPAANAEGATFEASLSMKYKALMLPETQLLDMLRAKRADALPPGAKPEDYSLGDPLYTVQAGPDPNGSAQIRAEAGLTKAN